MSFGSILAAGLDDDQPQSAWDSQIINWELNSAQVGSYLSPVFPVANFGYLYGRIGVLVSQCYLQMLWAHDVALADVTGQQFLTLDPNQGKCHFTMPHRGSYMQFVLQAATVNTQFTPDAKFSFTNRPYPVVTAAPTGQLITQNFNIPAGGSVTIFPPQYFCGTVNFGLFGGDQGMTVTAYVLGIDFAFNNPMWRAVVAANAVLDKQAVWPFGATKFICQNTSATTINTGASIIATCNLAA